MIELLKEAREYLVILNRTAKYAHGADGQFKVMANTADLIRRIDNEIYKNENTGR
jgi:hypothetical protein